VGGLFAAYLFIAKFVEWEFEDTGEFAFYKTGQEKSMLRCSFLSQMVLSLSPLAAHLNESLTSLRFATNVISSFFLAPLVAPGLINRSDSTTIDAAKKSRVVS
jgi:hypothetical protein